MPLLFRVPRLCCCFFLCLSLFWAYVPPAAAAYFEDATHADDQSLHFLGQLLGQVGGLLKGDTSNILIDVLSHFNYIILTLGILVLSYSTIVSLIVTAHEGQPLGRKWSAIWLPLRSFVGISCLIPLKGQLSLIQIFMVQVVLTGVGAANSIWDQVLTYYEHGHSINQVRKISPEAEQHADQLVSQVFTSLLCVHTINASQRENPVALRNFPLSPQLDTLQDTFRFGDPRDTAPPKDRTLCGQATWKIPEIHTASHVSAAHTALQRLVAYLDPYAATVAQYPDTPQNWYGDAVFRSAATAYLNQLPSHFRFEADDKTHALLAQMRRDGWILAGTFYRRLAQRNPTLGTETVAHYAPPQYATLFQSPAWNALPHNDTADRFQRYLETHTAQYAQAHGKTDATETVLLTPPTSTGGFFMMILNLLLGPFGTAADATFRYITTASGDPLQSLADFGDTLLSLHFWGTVGALGSIAALSVASAVMPGFSSIGVALMTVVNYLLPLISVLGNLLWMAACALALYLPLIPFMLFTFAAISWLIAVLETLVAAPLVALGLITPSGHEHFGRSEPAILLTTNVLLRPSLIVIGFLLGARLFHVGIDLLNLGMREFATIHLGTWFSPIRKIVAIVLYTGICITLTHKTFALIHILPDKVLRWIGGSPEQFGAGDTRDEQSAKQYGDQATQKTQGFRVAVDGQVTKYGRWGLGSLQSAAQQGNQNATHTHTRLHHTPQNNPLPGGG